jgi:biopolymer transport protein ExbD
VGFKLGDDDGGGMSEINVTPLIDIMLVMLIIFMIITPPALSQMAAKLPEKSESVPQDDVPKDQLVAAICEDGTFALNRTVMPLPDLRREVARRLRPKAKKVVFVDGHPDAPYAQVVLLMDTIRGTNASGVVRIGLGKLKEPEDFLSCTAMPAAPPEGAEGAVPAEGTAG